MMASDDGHQTTQRDVVGRRIAPGRTLGANGDFTYSVIEAAPAAPTGDRRGDRRIRTHLREALVREYRGRPIVECRIRDLSGRGARLQLDRERRLPRQFLLREDGTQRSFLATLVWQVGRDAGVKLTAVDDPKI